MNRIILIGNGFDLAHGLKTSYNDFLSWWWKKLTTDLQIDYDNRLIFNSEFYIYFRSQSNFDGSDIGKILQKIEETKNYRELFEIMKKHSLHINFSNILLEKILRPSTKLWIDIEVEFYQLVLQTSRIKNEQFYYHCLSEKNNKLIRRPYSPKRLNEDLSKIKNALAIYLDLDELKVANQNSDIVNLMLQPFDSNIWSEELLNKKKEQGKGLPEYLPSSPNKVKAYHFSSDRVDYFNYYKYKDIRPALVTCIDFNYTETSNLYAYKNCINADQSKKNYPVPEIIKIHGKMKDPRTMIFGYGDELDENYKSIENLNDNEMIKNFKSIRYSEDDQYKKILKNINEDDFEVYIMGHSCGLSDRTLLNTIFENDNCAAIRIFFYEREDGTDDFNDIVSNISRCFNDKKKMRDRVVNKKECAKMPQVPRSSKS